MATEIQQLHSSQFSQVRIENATNLKGEGYGERFTVTTATDIAAAILNLKRAAKTSKGWAITSDTCDAQGRRVIEWHRAHTMDRSRYTLS